MGLGRVTGDLPLAGMARAFAAAALPFASYPNFLPLTLGTVFLLRRDHGGTG